MTSWVSAGRLKKLYTEGIESDPSAETSTVSILSGGTIDLVPNVTNGNSAAATTLPTSGVSTNKVVVHGDMDVLGAWSTVGGIGTTVDYTINSGQTQSNNTLLASSSNHLTAFQRASATATHSDFPKNTDSYEVSFNLYFPALVAPAVQLFSYGTALPFANGPVAVVWISDGSIAIIANGDSASSSASTLVSGTHRIAMRRVFVTGSPALSALQLFVDGVQCIGVTGAAPLALHDLGPTPDLVLGGAGMGYDIPVSFDDMTTYAGTAPTYTTADSVGSIPLTYTATSSQPDAWIGEWFNDSGAPTSKANNVGGSSGLPAFTLPAGGDPVGGIVSVPASSTANTRYVTLTSTNTVPALNTTGSTLDDGYGAWTIEARAAFSGSTSVTVMWMGTDDGNRRIQVYPMNGGVLFSTESKVSPNYGDRQWAIPSSVLASLGLSASNDGAYHKYRLGRKSYLTVSGTISNPDLLFDFWYDDVKISLKLPSDIGVQWANSSTYIGNIPIQFANSSSTIRIGGTTRSASDAFTLDYIRVKNGITFADPSLLIPRHVNGYFQTSYGDTLTSYYSATGFTRPGGTLSPGTGLLFTGVVKPVTTSFALATGGSVGTNAGDAMIAPFACNVNLSVNTNENMVELLTVGNIATAGAYVSVWVWRGGKILLFNGSSYIETASAVVAASEFTLGVRLTTNEPILYINGEIPMMTTVGWRAMSTNLFTTLNTSVTLSPTASLNGIYLGARTPYASGTAITAAFKNWRVVDTTIGSGMTVVSLANTKNAVVASWAFDKDSAVSAGTLAVTMTVNANASISAGAMTTNTTGSATGTATYVAGFPTGTSSYEISTNIAFTGVPNTADKVILTYGTVIVKWKSDDSVRVDVGAANVTSTTFPLVSSTGAKKYKLVIRRTYNTSNSALSTFEVFVDGVNCITAVGSGTNAAVATHSLSSPNLVLGGDTYAAALSFDDVRIESVTLPTNATSDGAGIVVEGDGLVNGVAAGRSITWNKGTTQEKGDETGSYWLVKGGQLMLSRIIDTSLRKAPGSTVLLTSLPQTSGATTEPHMWTLSASVGSSSPWTTVDSVGTNTLTYTNSTTASAPDHATVPGYFNTKYGSAGYLTSNYGNTGFTSTGPRSTAMNSGTGLLFTGVIRPQTSFATATGGSIGVADATGTLMTAPFQCSVGGSVQTNANMVELLTIGDTATAGAYLSVWAWRGGKILMYNGKSYTETTTAVVGVNEFVLGIYLTSTEPILYINGTAGTMIAWRTFANATATVGSSTTGVIISSTASARGIWLGPRTAWVSGTTISAAYKSWRIVDTVINSMTAAQIGYTQPYRYANEYDASPLTVTYGFRIADDETLQLVKTEGSSSASAVLGNPMPASESAGVLNVNTLGTIADSFSNVVLSLLNTVP
eukprot:jgi/Mesvir1/14666/Mv05332-RA.1